MLVAGVGRGLSFPKNSASPCENCHSFLYRTDLPFAQLLTCIPYLLPLYPAPPSQRILHTRLQLAMPAQSMWSSPGWGLCEGVGRRWGITIRLWIFWDRYPIGLWSINPAPTAPRETEFLCQRVTALIFCCTSPAAVPAMGWYLSVLSLISETFFLTHLSLCNISCLILSFLASAYFCFSAVSLTAQKFSWIFLKPHSLAKHFVQFWLAGRRQSFLSKKY